MAATVETASGSTASDDLWEASLRGLAWLARIEELGSVDSIWPISSSYSNWLMAHTHRRSCLYYAGFESVCAREPKRWHGPRCRCCRARFPN